jgi:hypothetical protein
MIQPTIGRVVLFHVDKAKVDAGGQALPALVCFVHSDNLINVGGFETDGTPFAHTEVPLLQDDDAPPATGPYAEWMPYQKGQAAKTEQLQSQLATEGAEAGADNAESSGPVSA